MIRETLNAGVGAAALALEFVTNSTKQQDWIKKAERKGGRLTAKGEERLRSVTRELTKNVESVVEELRTGGVAMVRQSTSGARRQATTTRRGAGKVVRRARAAAPKARVSRTSTRTAGGRRAKRTTISVVTPQAKAS